VYQNEIDLTQASVQMLGIVTNSNGEPVLGSANLHKQEVHTCDIEAYNSLVKQQDTLLNQLSTICIVLKYLCHS
jgi:hypothetical protein